MPKLNIAHRLQIGLGIGLTFISKRSHLACAVTTVALLLLLQIATTVHNVDFKDNPAVSNYSSAKGYFRVVPNNLLLK